LGYSLIRLETKKDKYYYFYDLDVFYNMVFEIVRRKPKDKDFGN